MSDSAPKLFYSKCRPQNADAWPIAREARRVFVGYPVWRANPPPVDWRRAGIGSVFVNPRAPDWDDIPKDVPSGGYAQQVSVNRTLANSIPPGSIALVPRVSNGSVYAGRTTDWFQFVDRPSWAEDYLDLRRHLGLKVADELSHVGDVAQSWPIDGWRELPFPSLPRWISYRLLARNTAGIIWDLDDPPLLAWEAVDDLLTRPPERRYQASRKRGVERALLDWLTPASLEHLMVSLLQCEAPPGVFWHHVGGSGDGGVDGIAVDDQGHLVARLQCKWYYGGSAATLLRSMSEENEVRGVVAILTGHQSSPERTSDGTFYNRARIAALVEEHRTRLPWAVAMMAGEG